MKRKISSVMDSRKDILIVAHYVGVSGTSNSRFRELATILGERGASVELVTSSFRHATKKQRGYEDGSELPYKLTQIDEPGYKKNLTFQRLLSHRRMGKNLSKYLEGRKAPDVILCALPSLDVGKAIANFSFQHDVPLIWDVQDLWPEAFEMVIKPAWLARIVLAPVRVQANRLYKSSSAAISVSDTYSKRVEIARGSASNISTIYLGTDLQRFDQYEALPLQKPKGQIDLVYIGTLGHSYDLPLVFDACRKLLGLGKNIKLHVMGDGPHLEKWREESSDLGGAVVFYGRLSYPLMVARLKTCDIALNPIVRGSAGSVINKVCDYAAAGLPVVSTQESEEYQRMLCEFRAGLSSADNLDELTQTILKLIDDESLRRNLAMGSRNLAETKFDRAVTYREFADLVMEYA